MPAGIPSFLYTTHYPYCAMFLEFLDVCVLFGKLSQSCSGNQIHSDAIVRTWFQTHHSNLRRGMGGLALPSCLFPERRPYRIYGLQEKHLERIIEKALGLDFTSAVQQIMSGTEETPHPHEPMKIEEIEETLDRVASTCPLSSSEIRKTVGHVDVDATAELGKDLSTTT